MKIEMLIVLLKDAQRRYGDHVEVRVKEYDFVIWSDVRDIVWVGDNNKNFVGLRTTNTSYLPGVILKQGLQDW